MKKITFMVVICFFVLFSALQGNLFAMDPVKPLDSDKCPVCGMKVTPYPNWIAQIIFSDGSYAVFDGSKDMFKYYFDMNTYNKTKSVKDISDIYVTEYYSATHMKAGDVFFITGSDVNGPMGAELVPVKGKEQARTFMKDHGGDKMLRFDEITLKDIPSGMMHMK